MKRIIIPAMLLCSLHGYTQEPVQEMKQLSISYVEDKVQKIAGSCAVPENPIIIYYSKIKDLRFVSSYINDQRYIAAEQKYILCVKPARKYSIKIIHPDFATAKQSVDKLEERQVVEFILNPVTPAPVGNKYKINVAAVPNNAIVYLDGVARGKTPLDIETTPGWHAIKLKRDGYFTRTLYRKVKRRDITYVEKKMYSKTFVNLNAIYGFDAWGGEIGFTANNFSIAVNGLYNTRRNYYRYAPELPAVDELSSAVSNRDARVAGDSLGLGWAIKIGYTFGRPVITRIHVGYGKRDIFYRKTYGATRDFQYTDQTGQLIKVARNDVVKGNKEYMEQPAYYIAGAQVSLFRFFNVMADYWYNENQSIWVVGFGLNLFGR